MSLGNRLKKAESLINGIGIDNRVFINAYKRYYSGLDDGESITSLLSLKAGSVNGLSRFEANILALSELDKEAKLKDGVFRTKLGKSGRYVDEGILHV
jgi:hypothetical protein